MERGVPSQGKSRAAGEARRGRKILLNRFQKEWGPVPASDFHLHSCETVYLLFSATPACAAIMASSPEN